MSTSLRDYEREGLQMLIESDLLPSKMEDNERRALRKAGVKFRPYTNSYLFDRAELPPGWSKEATDSRWGRLTDDQGRERARFFYKTSPHDPKAYTQVLSRYTSWCTESNKAWCVLDRATDTVIWPDGPSDKTCSQAQAWLDENYPRWRDPSQYWENPSSRRSWRFWRAR